MNALARRRGILSIAPVMLLVLAGCAQSGAQPVPNTGDESPPLQIGGVAAVVNDPFFVTMRCGAEKAAAEGGATLNWQGPTSGDVTKQLQAFNSMVVSQPDGIMVTPFSTTAFIDPVKKAMANGIPVVVADSELDEDVALQTVRTTIGDTVKDLAKHAAESIDGKGAVSIIAATPGTVIDEERYLEFQDVMKNDYPGIKLLPVEFAKTDTQVAARIANAVITANPDLKLIYTTNGPQAAGVLSALKANKKAGTIGVFSYDATPVQVEGLRAGEFQGLLAQSPYIEGYESVKTLVEFLKEHKGEKNLKPIEPKVNLTPMMLLTPDNIDTDEAKKFTYVSSCK